MGLKLIGGGVVRDVIHVEVGVFDCYKFLIVHSSSKHLHKNKISFCCDVEKASAMANP